MIQCCSCSICALDGKYNKELNCNKSKYEYTLLDIAFSEGNLYLECNIIAIKQHYEMSFTRFFSFISHNYEKDFCELYICMLKKCQDWYLLCMNKMKWNKGKETLLDNLNQILISEFESNSLLNVYCE